MTLRDQSSEIILRTADHWGREITLTHGQWTGHVLAQHPELGPHLAAVAATLTDPERVMLDSRFVGRECFYRPHLLPPPFDHLYLKVVVELLAVGVGEVVTAYILPRIKRGEVQKWP